MQEKQKKRNRILSLAVCLFMLASLIIPANIQEASAAAVPGNPQWAADGSGTITWDCVSFGHYPQGKYNPVSKPSKPVAKKIYTDKNGTKFAYQKDKYSGSGSYFKVEPIKWRVLQAGNGEAFLLADCVLERDILFDETSADATWESSTLRNWLNGYGSKYASNNFMDKAFTQEEQSAILKKEIKTEDNPIYGTSGGNTTEDQIFVLSMEEAVKPEYGFLSAYGRSNTRDAKASAYVGNGSGDWWLRSPGDGKSYTYAYNSAASVSSGYGQEGEIVTSGAYIDEDYRSCDAVRPSLWLDLDSACWKSAGTVQSKGHAQSAEPSAPTQPKPLQNPQLQSDGTVTWDCVYLGHYPQGYDGKGGFRTDPIRWRVLSVNEDHTEAFLLADKLLYGDTPYNENLDFEAKVTWESCTLRSWLNGYGSSANKEKEDYTSDNFIDKAFTSGEQAAVLKKVIENKDNPEYGTEGGNNTEDKLFLLSLDEAVKTEYGFIGARNENGSKTCEAQNTAYASSGSYAAEGESNWWWLRSPGDIAASGAHVTAYGAVTTWSNMMNGAEKMVRPALYLDLTSDLWKNAGTVSSKGTIEKASQTIAAVSVIKAYGNKPFNLNAKAKGKLTYKSSDTKVATVSKTGTVTIKRPGKATITITAAATSKYKAATKKITITVNPGKAALTKVSSPKAGTLKASWKKDAKASGYQAVIAQNSKFTKGKKTAAITKNSATNKTFSKLKKKATYYVKVRAYKTAGKTKLYGAYSSVKKVKIK